MTDKEILLELETYLNKKIDELEEEKTTEYRSGLKVAYSDVHDYLIRLMLEDR